MYAGPVHLFHVPLPAWTEPLTGIFRSSGRMAWIALYLGAGLVVATVARWPRAMPVLALACGLQWLDAGALRAAVRTSVARPYGVLDRAAWSATLPNVTQVVVDPPIVCIAPGPDADRLRMVAVELQLRTARAGVPNNSLYAGRGRPPCTPPPVTPGALLVHLGSTAPAGIPCGRGALMTVCHATLALPVLQALATITEADPPHGP